MQELSRKETELYMLIIKANGISTPELIYKFSKKDKYDFSRTTVMTMLMRMEEKGYIHRARKGRTSYVYSNLTYEEFIDLAISKFIDTYFDGNATRCVRYICNGRKITK